MTKQYKVAVVIGSIRKESYSRKLGKALIGLKPADFTLDFVEIDDLPLYNEDLETANPPKEWTRFRDEMKTVDAIIFITPEYNRSIPGVMKNAIDVGSRPYGQGIWNGKPAIIISISQGALGGFGANHQLRQALVFNDVLTMQQPEAYIGHIQNIVTDDGQAVNDDSKTFLTNILQAFDGWVRRLVK
ncbi:NADPH-dependent FMN reductase [Bartonella tamiae]|uniref:NADPH-dependent FMN reductase-like domain-containing protein n=1 Tax=Bartonella tamiae Th239 TaxID=1094558 RepID=J0ZP48_9HYPH|nr:NAD(P)H-dependent oxidoreductase [Bartonella tamiae]EJF90348.1 hypothetical protein ME5_00749 [Bartonella tamiae Th239]EJF93711.1 hypothetical protein MEG_01135 [Bartonella tamiae Th307]